eukprot:7686396-Pyramimonas_sp.AAC.1
MSTPGFGIAALRASLATRINGSASGPDQHYLRWAVTAEAMILELAEKEYEPKIARRRCVQSCWGK